MKKILLLLLLCVASGLQAMETLDGKNKLTGDDAELSAAAEAGDFDRVVSLLKSGKDILFEFNGPDALFWASFNGHSDCVRTLVSAGFDPNKRYRGGQTALHIAAEENQAACIKALLERGAYHSPRDCQKGNTPLHDAVDSQDDFFESVEALLGGGADARALDKYGVEPIIGAVDKAYLTSAKLLLQAGSSPFKAGLEKEALLGRVHYRIEVREGCKCFCCLNRCDQAIKKFQEMIALLEDYQARWRGIREFCKAQHSRLGARSSAHALPKDLYREIFKWLLRHE